MTTDSTIVEAAQKALSLLGKPSTIEEIYGVIVDKCLYQFNTPTPEHVLRTMIRRHTKGVERVDSSETVFFEMIGEDSYKMNETTKQGPRKSPSAGMKRIHRATDKEDIIRALTGEQVGVFREIWKLLLFSAQIGVANKCREELQSVDSGKGIDQSTFGNCPSWPGIAYLMALVETERSDSLSGGQDAEENRILVFQEYANGGLRILQDFFRDRPVDLDGLLAFIETQSSKVAGPPDLELSI